MMVLAERYETRRPGKGRRFMSDSRKTDMETLKERIDRGNYEVDPQQVAAAIVRKLLTGNQ